MVDEELIDFLNCFAVGSDFVLDGGKLGAEYFARLQEHSHVHESADDLDVDVDCATAI